MRESRIQKSSTGENNFVKRKGTFRSDRPKRPDRSKVVSNIPVGPNRNGPFLLISNRNFQNFGLNGKRPLCSIVLTLTMRTFHA